MKDAIGTRPSSIVKQVSIPLKIDIVYGIKNTGAITKIPIASNSVRLMRTCSEHLVRKLFCIHNKSMLKSEDGSGG